MMKSFLLALAILTGSGLTAAKAENAPALVKTMVLSGASDSVSRTFFGQISAIQSVDLGFQVAGRIVKFNAPKGAVIEAGSVLAQLDRRPFEIAVERARIALEQAERTFGRYTKLSGVAVSEAQVQDAKSNVEMARVELENAEYSLEQTTLVAPFDAVVATRNVSNFSTVSAGTQIVRLHDLSEIYVDVEVPEVLIQRLGENPDMVLSARLPGNENAYPLQFKEVNAETSERGQTFRVTLTMDVPDTHLLLPGASLTVTAQFSDQQSGIEIDPAAVATDPKGKTYIFQVLEKSDGLTIKQTPVNLSVAPSGAITVISPLQDGAEVVVGGVNSLQDGQSIRRFTADFN